MMVIYIWGFGSRLNAYCVCVLKIYLDWIVVRRLIFNQRRKCQCSMMELAGYDPQGL
jgi:hypothetical protein